MKRLLESLVEIFYPNVCLACHGFLGDQESYLCTACRHALPVIDEHQVLDNPTFKVFYGRIKIEQATSLLLFEKQNITQNLIHNLKYRNHEDIGVFLGQWLGTELSQLKSYQQIDCVIPVPLHKKKIKKRGYNQVSKFGMELAHFLNAELIEDVLIKTTYTTSQVGKNRLSRWNNSEIFKLQYPEKIANKHILLVDDVITTGATMETCFNVLNQAQNVKISLASMAIAL